MNFYPPRNPHSMSARAVLFPIVIVLFLCGYLLTGLLFAGDADVYSDAAALWHMDEESGPTARDRGGKYNLNASNVKVVEGFSGRARYFNGKDSYITVPLDFKGWRDLSISLWVKMEPENRGAAVIFDKGYEKKKNFAVYAAGPAKGGERSYNLLFEDKSIGFNIPAGEWAHVTVVRDAGSKVFEVYLNGKKTSDAALSEDILSGDSTPLTLGRLAKKNGGYFRGAMDEVSVWQRPLSPEEVKRLYSFYAEKAASRKDSPDEAQGTEFLESKIEVLEQKVDGISAKIDSIARQVAELRNLYDVSVVSRFPQKDKKRPNVIMIISDSLRADHVSAINPKAEYKTRTIDRLAGMGAVFTNAITQGPHTTAAMGSIFTGLYPSEHKGYMGLLPRHRRLKGDVPVTEGISSFMDKLGANGYGSYVVTQRYSPSSHGMPITTVMQVEPGGVNRNVVMKPKYAIDNAIDFLKSAQSPYFLYLHVWDPHEPYDSALDIDPALPPRQGGPTYTEDISVVTSNDLAIEHKKYNIEIQGTDRELGRLVDYLSEKGYFEDNILIFLGDHGEYFNERSAFHSPEMPIDKLFPWPHGFDLHQELIHVPLVMVAPHLKKGTVVDQFVETRSLFSTIVEFTGSCCIDEKIHPKSLTSVIKERKGDYVISEGILQKIKRKSGPEPYPFAELKSIISPDGFKLIHHTLYKTNLLYNLKEDPLEQKPLDPRGREQQILELRRRLEARIDIDEDFIKPEPYDTILSMPDNRLLSGINASSSDRGHPIAYLIDENPETFWQNNARVALPVSLTFVFKEPVKVERLIFKAPPDKDSWFKNASLVAGDDGYKWDKIADVSVNDPSSGGDRGLDVKAGRGYRYYRINIMDAYNAEQNTVSISELKLLTSGAPK